MAGRVNWRPPGHIDHALQQIFDLKNHSLSAIKVQFVKQHSAVTLTTLHGVSNSSKHFKCFLGNAGIFVGGLLMMINVFNVLRSGLGIKD